MSRKVKGQKHPVEQLSLEGEVLAVWPSATEAAKQFKTTQGTISTCARGERETAKGFKWRYLTEVDDPTEVWKNTLHCLFLLLIMEGFN